MGLKAMTYFPIANKFLRRRVIILFLDRFTNFSKTGMVSNNYKLAARDRDNTHTHTLFAESKNWKSF